MQSKRIKHYLQLSIIIVLITTLMSISSLFGLLIYHNWREQHTVLDKSASSDPIAYADTVEKTAAGLPWQKQKTSNEALPPTAASKPKEQPNTAIPTPSRHLMQIPIIKQNPELPDGCEITSLAMLLKDAGFTVTKLGLVKQMKVDPTPIQWNSDGSIKYWGNPNTGFVGDITNQSIGFGIYHTALLPLLKHYEASAVDLTRRPFRKIEQQIDKGRPVIVWTTTDYSAPDNWVSWNTPLGPFRSTFSEHAVLLVGYDQHSVYVNDPLSGKAEFKIAKDEFLPGWEALGRQAISYT